MSESPTPDLAGLIRIKLRVADGAVVGVRMRSTRPTGFSRRLFAGSDVARLLGTLPMVFSVCATAQSSAAVQAVERACGVAPAAAHLQARELLVLAETAREHLFRILIGWSNWLGLRPAAPRLVALGRMRSAWARALYPGGDAFVPGGGDLRPDVGMLNASLDELDGLVELALGVGRAAWKQLRDGDAIAGWVDDNDAVAARMVGHVRAEHLEPMGRNRVPLLPPTPDDDLAQRMLADDSDAFLAKPTWRDKPRETGALQRRVGGGLVAALAAQHGNGLLTRQVARLDELVVAVDRIIELGAGLSPTAAGGADTSVSGSGVAQVEAARGRLAHGIRLERGQISDYRILAPTEWNFHPRGVLANALLGLPAGDELAGYAQLLVDAVDPCVDSRISIAAGDADA